MTMSEPVDLIFMFDVCVVFLSVRISIERQLLGLARNVCVDLVQNSLVCWPPPAGGNRSPSAWPLFGSVSVR